MAWCRAASRSVVLTLLVAGAARAEPPSESSALARALFDEGRALLSEKDYEHACPKFEEAQRLDPGGGTLLNLALCNELRGKTATAWAQFDEALRWARRDKRSDREEFAKQHLDALRPRLAKLRIIVPTAARTKGLVIKRNGLEVGEPTWGDWIPVDPGEQEIEAEATGKIPAHQSVRVGANGRGEVVIAPMDDLPSAPNEPARTAAPAPVVVRPAPAREVDVRPDATQRLSGLVLGGVGVVALGASAYFGFRAMDLNESSAKDCPSANNCDPVGFDENRRAHRSADIATGFAITGAAVVGVGAYLFFSAPSNGRASTSVGVGPGGARVVGRF